ncbi:transposase, IS4 family protein [gamma proteobacterium NOR5-3]|nr:transposase, IS4 family protein [gamma proteobacterium NOR5-3]
MAANLGAEGWCLAYELREGSQHAQKEFEYVLERVVPRARQLTDASLLVRLDGAHDARANRRWLELQSNIDYLIKWNPRGEDRQDSLPRFEAQVTWTTPRVGKRVVLYSEVIVEKSGDKDSEGKPMIRRVRRVMRLIERTIDRRGQSLLLPEYTLEGYWAMTRRSATQRGAGAP